jgi:hypothetical protein
MCDVEPALTRTPDKALFQEQFLKAGNMKDMMGTKNMKKDNC